MPRISASLLASHADLMPQSACCTPTAASAQIGQLLPTPKPPPVRRPALQVASSMAAHQAATGSASIGWAGSVRAVGAGCSCSISQWQAHCCARGDRLRWSDRTGKLRGHGCTRGCVCCALFCWSADVCLVPAQQRLKDKVHCGSRLAVQALSLRVRCYVCVLCRQHQQQL
jgi:hypothetical protein